MQTTHQACEKLQKNNFFKNQTHRNSLIDH